MRILKLSVITIAVLIGAFVLLLSSVFIYKRYIYDGERFFVSKANLKSYSNLLNASEMRLNAKEVHGVEKGSNYLFAYHYFKDDPQSIDEETIEKVTISIAPSLINKGAELSIPNETQLVFPEKSVAWGGECIGHGISGKVKILDANEDKIKIEADSSIKEKCAVRSFTNSVTMRPFSKTMIFKRKSLEKVQKLTRK